MEKDNKPLDETKASMNLSLSVPLMKRLNEASLNSNLTKTAYVRQAIEEKLKNDGYGSLD